MLPSRWKNFSVWRNRLPHWRADEVSYYVTFRHRRPLDEDERMLLFRALLKPEGRDWQLLVVCVLPDQSELIASLTDSNVRGDDKLSTLVEKAKVRAGKAIIKETGERFPPFYTESYDRILRDESERDTFLEQILSGPTNAGLEAECGAYETLWLPSPGG